MSCPTVPESCDAVVIGAGVVGLAVARELALAGREALVLERHDRIGAETSSRHSEVIHAGIYYPTGSLKARTCVRGKALLYEYCRTRGVPHARIGQDHRGHLRESLRRPARLSRAGAGEWSGGNCRCSTPGQWRCLEPAVRCLGGIYSESTGIVDSHALMLSLQGDLEAHGGVVSLCTEVTALRRHGDRVGVRCGDYELSAATVVNSAGLFAPALARAFRTGYRGFFAKGHYYALSGSSPFTHLVYPVAESGGLGVHVTLDLAGQARFGPDVMWIDAADYDFDTANRDRFVAAIRRYYPALDEERLHPGYTGIRPKIVPAGRAGRRLRDRGGRRSTACPDW